ncbi:MAG: DHH family phosphoesterase, partial [Candidatus Bathyarchaeota archaeon]|nr:DHH family phosphoesterase [Candidatus Bathyarchaeota archaeon]
EMIARLPAAATRLGRLAYVEAEGEEPIGTVANLIVDALGVEVGLCYKVKAGSRVSVSLRSRRGLAFHLGEITRRVAVRRGGFGGGHKRASGASLPLQSLEGFIGDVAVELGE